ncbi:hypothetical protein KVR01_008658 [Diaporthe batatas]|uniref:uncharacterized protein n=1 Tax=Diaporthe batatas TaxID=748121 RepID=UPI001D0396B4|nr:uncharacterized protein KVR01_008658 [Diaporthe batatas]KAG8161671.1 hypothetical protein KVR01_008658 [Diaporthe batatas]
MAQVAVLEESIYLGRFDLQPPPEASCTAGPANTAMMARTCALWEAIEQAKASSEYPRKADFWPEGSLSQVIERKHVSTELYPPAAPSSVDNGLIQFVEKNGTKLLAICLMCRIRGSELKRAMREFKDRGLYDKSLPVSEGDLAPYARRLGWYKIDLDNFLQHQWKFVVPTFSRSRCLMPRLSEGEILPFLQISPAGKGSFGTVYKVKVHPAHFDRGDPIHQANCYVAIKEVILEGKEHENLQDDTQNSLSGRECGALLHIRSKESSPASVKHIIYAKAIFDQGRKRYYMFPWADGGNLWDLCEKHGTIQHGGEGRFIADILTQLLGLAEALSILHQDNCRHGDLKPENILVFGRTGKLTGSIWKIADLGLAKFHSDPTAKRAGPTSTKHGTFSYEPPEFLQDRQPTSRLYDIWSMGCIILQLITWLLYDIRGVDKLTLKTRNPYQMESTFWNQRTKLMKWGGKVVHEEVTKHMKKIMREFTGSDAIRDLLKLVRDKLLVVRLPSNSDNEWQQGYRANAKTLHNELRKIVSKGKDDPEYWFKGETGSLFRSPSNAKSVAGVPGDQRRNNLNEVWKFIVDNSFARDVIISNQVTTVARSITIWPEPSERLCGGSCRHLDSENVSTVCFDRQQSNLRLNKKYPPVMTLLQGPGLRFTGESLPGDLQIGLPRLPETEDPFKFDILRRWLHDCDKNHRDCMPRDSSQGDLPRRLINVGKGHSSVVKLYETQDTDNMKYFALSHPWGNPPHFCTYPDNIDEHRKGVPVESLPRTFRDAITVTRQLGFQYIWIDSLCIIQGKQGDFDTEGKRMEGIFSHAYCVLAASGATNQTDGFLKPIQQRNSVGIQQPGKDPLYICEFMDDFKEHVLNSRLNQRGWVLQERVLARRTIYFSNKQSYWECGRGVRCESMTKMENGLVSFSGDPQFPRIAVEASRGGRIILYQDLYTKYTRLILTRDTDRPIAIAGLEKRLISSFQVSGGFGIFDDPGSGLLLRSLLWCRATDVGLLEMIDFQSVLSTTESVSEPPTWSWMAYNGAIRYLDIPFGRVEWEHNDVRSPWSGSPVGTWTYSRDRSSHRPTLTATVRMFDSQAAYELGDALFLDDPRIWAAVAPTIACVIFGRLKSEDQDSHEDTLHYVLLVAPTESRVLQYNSVYRRVGVGIIRGSFLLESGLGSRERIF